MSFVTKLMRGNILFLLIFFLLACFITYPLIFNLTSLATGYGDELLIAWNHNWDIYNFSFNIQNLLHIFDANIFFPFKTSLAFSDAYFTNSILALIPVMLLDSPIVANNFTIILSLTLVGFFTFKLSKLITNSGIFSFISGVLIIFSPAYLSELVHIQIIAIYFVTLSIIFLINFLQTKKTFYFILFLIFFIAQIYNSFMPGYFIVFTAFFIILFYYFKYKTLKIFFTKYNVLLALISLLLILLITIPYFKVSKQFNYVRDIRETIHFALQPEDFLSANDFGYTRFKNLLSSLPFSIDTYHRGEVKPGFLGLTFSVLFLFSFFYIIKNWKKQNYIIKGIFVSSILGLILSLGPFLHIQRATIHNPFPIPLPYLFFYYLMPGFKGFRNSARFEMLFILLIAPIIAVYLKEALKNIPINIKYGLILSLAVLSILEFNFPIKYYPVPQKKDFPKVYSWLSTTPKQTVIIEMPIYNWNNPYAGQEFWREYYSTLNFRKTVNGASGFSPAPWEQFVTNLLAAFPSENSISKLKKIGVNLIVVHQAEYETLYKDNFMFQNKKISNGNELIKYLMINKNLSFEKQFDKDYVFRIK